jgi:hypothetical protein
MASLVLLARWVTVVKHTLVLKVVKNTCLFKKKTDIGKFHILMDLDELQGDFDNALLLAFALPLDSVPLHLDDRSASDHLSSLDIINGKI